MLRVADTRAIGLFDDCTAVIQRHGLMPLNTVLLGTECLFWSTGFASNFGSVDWSYCVMAGVGLALGFVRWQFSQGYWENHRKAQSLNAWVSSCRDWWRFRLATACIALAMMAQDLMRGQLIGTLSGAVLICLMYLQCCRYLGPGDFAREKRESLSGLPQES